MEPIENLIERMAGLSPAKRALLELRLKKKVPDAASQQNIPRRTTQGTAPLSFAQQRLWFLDQLEPESHAYNQPKVIRISGTLQIEALQKSLDAIVVRHEALRTTFVSVDGNPVQVIGKSRPVELPVIELEGPAAEREAEIHRLIVERTQQPFDLSQDLMLRAALLRLGEKEHILLLVTHHIASDGWSSGILSREIARFYETFSAGDQSAIPELPIQYADYAVWQRQWLQGEVLESQLSYWKRQLGDSRPVLELPTDRPRPATQTFRGARQSQGLPLKLAEALKNLSQQEGVTLFMTLLAAFQTLLYRYTGQDDVIVGSPIAGRTRVETEGLIGFFVNTLVLRSNLSGNPSFRELLTRVRKVALGAYAHQDLPFEKIVEELKPDRDLGHTPLFQVLFAFQNAPVSAMELQGLTLTPLSIDSETAKFDLSLYMVETKQGLTATLEYNTDLFEATTITRMLGHLQTLLERIVARPDQSISELPVLIDQERKQLLVDWNTTGKTYSKDKCLHQLFEAQVEQTPDAVAVMFEDKRLTYQELNQQANRLAHHLQKLGVGPDVLVGICMERSVEVVIGLLGILKAGGAYVPLDPAYPKERLAFMLDDSKATVVLTQRSLLAGFPEHGARVVCLDTDGEGVARESEENPASETRAGNLAYVIYTSGSTGKPKGVQIPHRALVNFLDSMRHQPGLTSQDTVLAVTTLSFDIAGLEIFLPITTGGRVVLASREVAADGSRLSEQISTCGATVMQATPATWRLLLESGWKGSERLKILCGGEALPRELADQLLGRCSSLWNMYGPTETTVWSAVYRVESGEGAVPIGRPIANTQIYILDTYLQPVPIGVAGELLIGGDGLARGYLNRPELTAEKFICNPFSPVLSEVEGDESSARLYRTGDLARYLPDGNIELLGRIDHQVKIRGFRIELGEIEAALSQHPAVNRSVVAAREGGPGEKWLAAYVVPDGNPMPTVNELRSFLKEKLPDYMVPSAFVFLDTLPLTPNGKIDRKALPESDKARPALEKVLMAPRDSIELQLTKLWEEVLNIKPIGIKDNFFDLGGYSLLAVRLFNHIEKTLNRKLPLATLFRAPTIEQLANILRGHESPVSWSSLVVIQPNGSKPPFFCVHAHGGNVLNFNDLARRLGSDQPFYGLQAQGLDGEQPRHTRVEDMAAHYVEEIRTLQHKGPYFIGGYCFGGKVAFEMAHQLHAQGQEVAMLALIDSYAPGYPKLLPWFQRRVIHRINYHWGNLKSLGSKEWLNYALEKERIVRARIVRRGKKIASKLYLGLGLSLPPVLLEVQEKERRLPSRYPRKVYPGKLTVFSPSKGPRSYYHDPHMGWEGLATGGTEVHEIPGKFASIIVEPSVQILAQELTDCIDKARAEGSNKQR